MTSPTDTECPHCSGTSGTYTSERNGTTYLVCKDCAHIVDRLPEKPMTMNLVPANA